MHEKEVASRRKASLVEAGFEDAEAEESLELYAALSDEAFDAIIAKWWDKKKKDDKKDDKKEDKKEEASVEASEEVTEEADETEAAEEAAEGLEEAFEEVLSTEATLVEPAADELQTTRASISEWLSSNVLNK
jgi:hypothetical protein